MLLVVGVFDGGNDFPTSGKLLTFESDRNYLDLQVVHFRSPSFQQLQFKITQNNLTGSVTFFIKVHLMLMVIILNHQLILVIIPFVNKCYSKRSHINFANFSGSVPTTTVGSIVYTASLEDLEEFETVYRLEDGDNAPTLLVTSMQINLHTNQLR